MFRLFSTLAGLGTLVLVCASSLTSCSTKTITEVDTLTLHHTDTLVVYQPNDPPLIRFVSLLPDRTSIVLYRDALKQSLFCNAPVALVSSYVPIQPSTSYMLYADYFQAGQRYLDSFRIPALPKGSISTFSLSRLTDGATGRIVANYASDSVKTGGIPEGYCLLRFMNGINNWPASRPYCYVDLDSLKHSLYYNSYKAPQTIEYGTLSDYALVPAGTHRVIIRNPDSDQQLESQVVNFSAGLYYSAQVTGDYSNNTDILSVYQE